MNKKQSNICMFGELQKNLGRELGTRKGFYYCRQYQSRAFIAVRTFSVCNMLCFIMLIRVFDFCIPKASLF